jgi:hypothetical protein
MSSPWQHEREEESDDDVLMLFELLGVVVRIALVRRIVITRVGVARTLIGLQGLPAGAAVVRPLPVLVSTSAAVHFAPLIEYSP